MFVANIPRPLGMNLDHILTQVNRMKELGCVGKWEDIKVRKTGRGVLLGLRDVVLFQRFTG